MSRGFKAVLFFLFLFAGFWIYQLRERELRTLKEILAGLRGEWQADARGGLGGFDGGEGFHLARSPVEQVLDPLETLVSASWSPENRPGQLPESPAGPLPSSEDFPETGAGEGMEIPEEASSGSLNSEAEKPDEAATLPSPGSSSGPAPPASEDHVARYEAPRDDGGTANRFFLRNFSASCGEVADSSVAGEARNMAEPQPAEFVEIVHVVSSQDTLWSIAGKYLGKGCRYPELFQWNQLDARGNVGPRGKHLLLRIPKAQLAPSVPSSAMAPRPPNERPDDQTGERGGPRLHQVKDGETLRKLARQYYKDKERWKEIYQANKALLENPHSLKVGMTLKIPNPLS
ncbi:MAG: LysM peptidoglycan-binding domain-containing protein [Planctomycetes bacterium]|nr:LysM peptidoglycan-binding domain-containing protein [Planctomycetota bacterium]